MGTAQAFENYPDQNPFLFWETSSFNPVDWRDLGTKIKTGGSQLDVRQIITKDNWLDEIKEELNELESLEENWDSYDAPKIDKNLISNAKILLENIYSNLISPPKPFIVPVINGSIDIEWEYENKFFALKLRKDNWRFYYSNRNDRSDREKDDLDQRFDKIQPILKKYLKLVYGREM